MLDILDEASRDKLDKDGYVLLHNVISYEILTKLSIFIKDMFRVFLQSGLSDKQLAFWSSTEENRTLRLPSIEKIDKQGLIAEAGQLMLPLVNTLSGRKNAIKTVHSFYKPICAGGETPLHQDPAYEGGEGFYDNYTIWLPLADVPVESSCFCAILGTHLNGLIPHKRITSANSLKALVVEQKMPDPLLLPTIFGDAIVHKSYLVHGAKRNDSSGERYSLVFVYSAS